MHLSACPDLLFLGVPWQDVTIRMRALDLLTSMVSKRTIKSIIRKLTDHLNTAVCFSVVLRLVETGRHVCLAGWAVPRDRTGQNH